MTAPKFIKERSKIDKSAKDKHWIVRFTASPQVAFSGYTTATSFERLLDHVGLA